MTDEFRAILLTDTTAADRAHLTNLPRDRLPAGDVLVRVRYSALNYKDC